MDDAKQRPLTVPNSVSAASLGAARPATHASKRAQHAGKADPIYRRVDQLVLLIVSVMQFGVELQPGGPSLLIRGHPDEVLSLEEVRRYCKQPTRRVFEAANSGSE